MSVNVINVALALGSKVGREVGLGIIRLLANLTCSHESRGSPPREEYYKLSHHEENYTEH